jgi:hypothetical protein
VFRRELLLGDGVQSVQAMPSGVIWTSYVDEGIFGRLGWSRGMPPFAAALR